jgi:ComF family protein
MDLVALVRAGLELGASLLSPPRCLACKERTRLLRVFCARCAASVVRAHRSDALFLYGGAIAQAIVRFKYGPEAALARPLGELLRHGLPLVASFAPDVVVPVPLHGTRLVARGFNQAALLAAPVARDLKATLAARALVRTRDTPQQAALDRQRRLVNMRRAFTAREPRALEGKRVLLVDDVRTTGATLRACEEALCDAGARAVRALVLAASEA